MSAIADSKKKEARIIANQASLYMNEKILFFN